MAIPSPDTWAELLRREVGDGVLPAFLGKIASLDWYHLTPLHRTDDKLAKYGSFVLVQTPQPPANEVHEVSGAREGTWDELNRALRVLADVYRCGWSLHRSDGRWEVLVTAFCRRQGDTPAAAVRALCEASAPGFATTCPEPGDEHGRAMRERGLTAFAALYELAGGRWWEAG